MRDKLLKVVTVSAVLLLLGCTTGGSQQTGTGVRIVNELSSDRMQPGGTVLLRSSINNFFENELDNAQIKLVRTFGSLTIDPAGVQDIQTIQANPNATARQQWQLSISSTATSGTEFTDRVRLCFTYSQMAWHDVNLINSFDVESEPNTGSENGPLVIIFSGLDTPYVSNNEVHSQIPVSVSIRNNYPGYVGTINMPKDQVANLTRIEMRIYDEQGGCTNNGSPCTLKVDSNGEPTTNLAIVSSFTSPKCDTGDTQGCFNCSNALWNDVAATNTIDDDYFNCYANNISMFGDETFIGTKLNITSLNVEELIERIEVNATFDYCVESSDFVLTVFSPGGK